MGPLYDQLVLKPGDLPIEQELAKIGLGLAEQTKIGSEKTVAIQKRPDITHTQQTLLAEWLRSRISDSMPPPHDPPTPLAAVKIGPKSVDDYTGRYEVANGVMINVTSDGHGLSAGFPDSAGAPLTPVSADAFFYTRRNAQLSFLSDSQGEVTGILWKQGGAASKRTSRRSLHPFHARSAGSRCRFHSTYAGSAGSALPRRRSRHEGTRIGSRSVKGLFLFRASPRAYRYSLIGLNRLTGCR
jgi:hypothetical protein